MSSPAIGLDRRPSVRIGSTSYPVLLPSLRDPRLHLAVVITSLQILGQVAFQFRLSLAQIAISLGTCALLETAIALRRQRVLLWPASALLTGNGVAFILRVPGTEHGDWWSLRGWWIFAGTSAVALLSKHVIRFRGSHVFNPSNIGLVVCFVALGSTRSDPLEFWWAPMSAAMAVALAIIVAGGFAILLRLRLFVIAASFWLTFAAAIGIVALAGHEMTARWHLGPITGGHFWWVLVSSPEILVFLFFMITDPRTVPEGFRGRAAFGIAVGLLAALLIAPSDTEFWSKVAVLGALAIASAARPVLGLVYERRWRRARSTRFRVARGALAAGAAAALLVVAGAPARPTPVAAASRGAYAGDLPRIQIARSNEVASTLDRATGRSIAADLARALTAATSTLRNAGGQQVPVYEAESLALTLEESDFQEPPRVVATLTGTVELIRYLPGSDVIDTRTGPLPWEETLELSQDAGGYRIARSRAVSPASLTGLLPVAGRPSPPVPQPVSWPGLQLEDVAEDVGLDFRHGAFRFGVTQDPAAMMGGGVCWLDYDADGWLDLFVVNSYAESDVPGYLERGGLPRSALFHNVRGRFENVTKGSGAGLAIRGNGCVAADFDLDGRTDLFVTGAAFDALLWNEGGGRFREGSRDAGLEVAGWHAGAAVADVDGNGWPDLFVAGYTDIHAPLPGSVAGFPDDHRPLPDALYLNLGPQAGGRPRFREVARAAGIERTGLDHGLGAAFLDIDDDTRPDLYVANDLDPNRLYLNEPWPGGAEADPLGLGFRLRERGRALGVDDPNAGMGVAAADWSGDGAADLFVTNNRGQRHAAYTSAGASAFRDDRAPLTALLGTDLAGWGVTATDLDLDGRLDLAFATGRIPLRGPAGEAQRLQLLRGRTDRGLGFARASAIEQSVGRRNARGLAAADFDNDGRPDLAVNSIGGRLLLLRNTGVTDSWNWLALSFDRFVPGTKVTVVLPGNRTLVRTVQAGSSYLSAEDPRLQFGLGPATSVPELLVRFPDGTVTTRTDIRANRVVRITVP
ncbi:MAG: FG-GAP-like repeat-containing protein [Gaiella sp.]